MAGLRESDQSRTTQAFNHFVLLASCSFLILPAWANSRSATLGTIVFAERAHIGSGVASVGATVFAGDRLSTEERGSIQLRTTGARLLLAAASSVSLAQEEVIPAATLTLGTATFATSDAKALLLHIREASIRPATDRPTIGRVTILSSREFIVRSTQGSLSLAVEDDVRVVPEGAAYRVVLEPPPAPLPQGAQGVGSKDYKPRGAAKNRFAWYIVAAVGVATFFSVDEALESPDRP